MKTKQLRGGSFGNLAVYVRSAYRYDNYPDFRLYSIGFRVARTSVRFCYGGAFYNNAGSVRSAHRNYGGPGYRDDYIGFRVAKGTS